MFTLRPRGIKARFHGFFTFFRGVYFLLTGNTKASDLKGDQSFLSFVNVCCEVIYEMFHILNCGFEIK